MQFSSITIPGKGCVQIYKKNTASSMESGLVTVVKQTYNNPTCYDYKIIMYMKGFYLFFAFFFLLINLNGQNAKVIIDADTGNDIDDMPAIVMAIKSGKIDIVALTASQWNRFEVCGRQTMHESWVFNNRILKNMELEHIPSLKGAEYAVGQEQPWGVKKPNEASDFIVKKAMGMPVNEKLIVIVSGPATNVATAILTEPKIVEKIAMISTVRHSIRTSPIQEVI